ncbi:MAG: hypothetical protein MnENMB40S_22570 [Rhizobiaceae bacterium MnEN-MB40S]|nr:MAG: hypothetical protein MnENMB40S_22570 [Rhizobiaceae bacterium MnEN-MB40S]
MTKIRGMQKRSNGRYYARKRIPDELRIYFNGQREFTKALGATKREANAQLPIVMADFERQIAEARRISQGDSITRITGAPAQYQLTDNQIASANYLRQLELDMKVRNTGKGYDLTRMMMQRADKLKRIASGRASNLEILDDYLISSAVEQYRDRGNHNHSPGTPEWRKLAMLIASSYLETFARIDERDDANFGGKPSHPAIDTNLDINQPVSIKQTFEAYLDMHAKSGRGEGARRRWTSIFNDLVKHLGHDDANRITKKDIMDWRDAKVNEGLAKVTIKNSYLGSVKAVLRWAAANDRIKTNPAQDVELKAPRPQAVREKGFRDDEALAILKTAKSYVPARKESPKITAAKRWIPILCAHTGARVGEIAQLRKQDIFEQQGIHAIRITPEAGTVKAGGYRNVPLHRQLIDEGFLEFVEQSEDGYLFIRPKPGKSPLTASRSTQNRLREWLNNSDLIPDGITQPNHAWRHRFKTVGWEVGAESRVIDAIQGHAARTSGEAYGDVTLKARYREIKKMPSYDL